MTDLRIHLNRLDDETKENSSQQQGSIDKNVESITLNKLKIEEIQRSGVNFNNRFFCDHSTKR